MTIKTNLNTEILNRYFINNKENYKDCTSELLRMLKTMKTFLNIENNIGLTDLQNILCSKKTEVFSDGTLTLYMWLLFDGENQKIVPEFNFFNDKEILSYQTNKNIFLITSFEIDLSELNFITEFLLSQIQEDEFKNQFFDKITDELNTELINVQKEIINYSETNFLKVEKFLYYNFLFVNEDFLLSKLTDKELLFYIMKNDHFSRMILRTKKTIINKKSEEQFYFIKLVLFLNEISKGNSTSLNNDLINEFKKIKITYNVAELFLIFIYDYYYQYRNNSFLNFLDEQMIPKLLFDKFKEVSILNEEYLQLNKTHTSDMNNIYYFSYHNSKLDFKIRKVLELLLNIKKYKNSSILFNFQKYKGLSIYDNYYYITEDQIISDNNKEVILTLSSFLLSYNNKTYKKLTENLVVLNKNYEKIYIIVEKEKFNFNKDSEVQFLKDFLNKDILFIHSKNTDIDFDSVIDKIVILDNTDGKLDLDKQFPNTILYYQNM
jgi:hypothetical protein